MVSTVTLLQTVYDELAAVCQSATSVTDVDTHVGVLNRTKDAPHPFFGFEYTRRPNNRGMGGNVRVTDVSEATDTVDIDETRDYILTVDIGVLTDGDDSRTRDTYLEAVNDRFSTYVRSPSDLHTDVERVRGDGGSPDPLGSDVDTGLRQSYVVHYATTSTDSVPRATSIDWNVDIESGGTDVDAYPERY